MLMYERNNSESQKFYFDKVLKETGKQTIEDGEYEIRSAINSNRIFDIKDGSNNSGAKLQLCDDCNVEQQRFIVKYIREGFYKITVRKSKKKLDVTGGELQEGISIQQYDENNTDAQSWIIKETEDGYYNIISKCNGLYITDSSNVASWGAQILMYEKNNSNAQKFVFEKIVEEKGIKSLEDGLYEIRLAINDNKVLDIAGGSIDSGAKLQVWEDSNVPQQRFIIKYIGEGLYKILVRKSEKALDVTDGVMQNGNSIQQWDFNNTDAQKWIIKENEDNTYSIISKGTGLYMTLASDNANNGTSILTFGKNNTENQKFTFEKITEKKGIDVSSYQGKIDWKSVKESGIDFAMIRVGYRGWGTGKIVYDKNYEYNIENAIKNGIECGVYFYSQAINEQEAIEEADFIVDAVKKYNLKYPIAIDSEYATTGRIGRADNLSVEVRTKVCRAFSDRIAQRGYKPMIYASKFWLYDNLDISKLQSIEIWLAHYVNGAPERRTDYKGQYSIWQYTSQGYVSGIEGYVDLDIIFE